MISQNKEFSYVESYKTQDFIRKKFELGSEGYEGDNRWNRKRWLDHMADTVRLGKMPSFLTLGALISGLPGLIALKVE